MKPTTKYFLINASRDHVLAAVKAGIVQAGHGRKDLVSRLSKGDRIIFYSPKDVYEQGKPLQRFTAIGQVADEHPYQAETEGCFMPWRRAVAYDNSIHEAEIRPLLPELSFITNKKSWGVSLMGGFREIPEGDFDLIAQSMK